MRKLATVRRITALTPIPGADFIECATVDGWECVVKKGEFEVGGLGVYFEIDSMLPEEERYSFLKKLTNTEGGCGYRLKTIKLRKQISQGMILPFSFFEKDHTGWFEDENLTERLGVWLYEPPVKKMKGSRSDVSKTKPFPWFLRKTDQERIQNKMTYFVNYKEDHFWEATKKLDGSSMTVWNYDKAGDLSTGVRKHWSIKWAYDLARKVKSYIIKPPTFGVCSRNLNLERDKKNNFWRAALNGRLDHVLRGHNIALQGELIGPSIQQNHEKVDAFKFYVFDIFDIDEQKYLTPDKRAHWLSEYGYGVSHVPIVEAQCDIFNNCSNVKEMQNFVEGESMNPGTVSEGMVFKSNKIPGLSFKCISNKYLLKCEK